MSYEVQQKLLSWDEAKALYPDTPFELHDGVVYAREAAPFAPHQRVVVRMIHAHVSYLDEHPGTGEALVAPFDVKFATDSPAIVLQPDVLFVAAAHSERVEEFMTGPPDIAVEVVSASSARTDTMYKRNKYAKFGVPEYWIAWPDEHRIDVLRLVGEHYVEAESLKRGDTLTSPQLPGFAVPVERLFRA